MSKYRIGALSSLLNIPLSTLRYYESCGVLPAKHDDNGYRYYDDVDVHNLMHYSLYRSYGVNQGDAKQLLYDDPLDTIQRSLKDVLAQQEKELWFNQRKVECLRSHNAFIQQIESLIGKLMIVERPALMVLPYRKRIDDGTIRLLNEKPREVAIGQWMKYLPLVQLTPLIFPDDFMARSPREGSALMIRQTDYQLLDIPDNKFTYLVEPSRCVRYVFYRQHGFDTPIHQYCQPVYDYLQQKRFKVNGLITFAHYLAYRKHHEHAFVGMIDVPIVQQ